MARNWTFFTFGFLACALVALGIHGTLLVREMSSKVADESKKAQEPLYKITTVRNTVDNSPALKITSSHFWVDSVEIPNLIRSHGGKVVSWDWNRGIWTVDGDLDAHVAVLKSDLDKLAHNLKFR